MKIKEREPKSNQNCHGSKIFSSCIFNELKKSYPSYVSGIFQRTAAFCKKFFSLFTLEGFFVLTMRCLSWRRKDVYFIINLSTSLNMTDIHATTGMTLTHFTYYETYALSTEIGENSKTGKLPQKM